MTSDLDCSHESWECSGNWHTCTDCREALGTRDAMLLTHDADSCGICPPWMQVCACVDAAVCDNCGPSQKWLDSIQEQFVTKDSGQHEEFDSGMRRDTQEGKARYDLLFPKDVPYSAQFLTRVGELLARGAEKYSERNWEQAAGMVEMERFKASAMRHLAQWMAGEVDEDHAAAVVFNLLGAETLKWKMDNEH